jgi:hypothetical protein
MTTLITLRVCIDVLGSTVCVCTIVVGEKIRITTCAGHGSRVNGGDAFICQMVIYDAFRSAHCNDCKPTINLFDTASACFE